MVSLGANSETGRRSCGFGGAGGQRLCNGGGGASEGCICGKAGRLCPLIVPHLVNGSSSFKGQDQSCVLHSTMGSHSASKPLSKERYDLISMSPSRKRECHGPVFDLDGTLRPERPQLSSLRNTLIGSVALLEFRQGPKTWAPRATHVPSSCNLA